jgi:hypothetical protein
MPAYDASLFDPPAPLATVRLRNPVTGLVVTDVPMLLDTGADVTVLPEPSVARASIALDPSRRYEVTGFDGSRSLAPFVEAHLLFLSRVFRGRYLVIGSSWGVIGRDILNHDALLFDGRNLAWDESGPL